MIRPALACCLLAALAGCSQAGDGEARWDCPRVDLGPGTHLHGYVAQDGRPAQGAAVAAESGGAAERTGSTDDGGCFMLLLEPGAWDVVVTKGGASAEATLQLEQGDYRRHVFELE